MIRKPFRTALLTLATLSAVLPAMAQSGTPAAMAPLANPDPRLAAIHAQAATVHAPGAVALSPDGTLVAYTIRQREGSTLHLIASTNPDPAKEKLIAPTGATACSNGAPIWSPDSQTLAFTSSCTSKEEKPGQDQIFLYSRTTGEVRQLTHLSGLFQQAAWSPDGKSLGFLFVENATRSAGALAAMTPWSGVIGHDNVEVQRIYTVDVQHGIGTFLTPLQLHVYEFSWSPDSRQVTYIAAPSPGENNWWIAKLFIQAAPPPHDASSRSSFAIEIPKVLFDPAITQSSLKGLQIAVPRFSPNGKTIAFIGGLMSDQGSTGGDIWTIPAIPGPDAANNSPTDVTPNIDGTPAWLSWLDNTSIAFVEERRGHTLLVDGSIVTKAGILTDDLGEVSVSGGPIKDAISIASTGDLAFVRSGHATAPEVVAGRLDALRPITHLNDGVKSTAHVESVNWTSPIQLGGAESFNVQGWLTYPVNYDPAKKYPLLVIVHGGPSASAGAGFANPVWSELGYFVLAPNPRGSFGQGEAFTAANIKDFGYGDLRDITAGMDAIEAKIPAIDHTREGLTGWSYGGFMTMFAVTQTHRFRAAVAGAGLSDWLSYYGENSIDQWMLPFFGATVYDDPAVYAKSSAITFIKHVTTPTLVIVGDRDGECPAPQSFEFWHALRDLNVKTELVVYPNEGHGFVDPDHIRDREAREVAWFAQNMPAQ